MDQIDYSVDTPQQTTDQDLTVVSDLANLQIELEDALESAEAVVEGIKERLQEVKERRLPDALRETGLTEVRLSTGHRIVVRDQVFASIPVERRGEAFIWLDQHGFADLIKNEVVLSFGKGEDARANNLIQQLTDMGFQPQNKKQVHPQTLKAFVREQLESQSNIPQDLFGVMVVPSTKIERRKEKT